ncbi:Asp-tRNA(Asn)/Glu-tRNA(Gln) amidotransferase subunit GatC [Candidatus Cyrtobacter comes]|uniref:Asp-tRNA(Asn)/Glu-tRNA(Gln) amidotransferase subunit GatC n=1 Tax=Candidatus Cyrtobacter comes TaxID=675776 RepID=UPI002ACD9207|nr:Asp-tRNA(Asn)/Glu-tRNA(Gln) amidotransferase subunit GatC [Candidatus Cyrtobacter comes]
MSKVVRSAAISLTNEELLLMEKSIDRINDFFVELKHVDVSGISPLVNPSSHKMEARSDCVEQNVASDVVLSNVPDLRHGYICVPKVG